MIFKCNNDYLNILQSLSFIWQSGFIIVLITFLKFVKYNLESSLIVNKLFFIKVTEKAVALNFLKDLLKS